MLNIHYDADTIRSKRALLRQEMLLQSDNVKNGNFEALSPADLELLFLLYNEIFFCGFFRDLYGGRMKFTLSHQFVRSAGLTRFPRNFFSLPPENRVIEIKISLNHLAAYDLTQREKPVAGLPTSDRLDALLLVFEHELCHAAEFLLYGTSSCRGKRFKALSGCIFGHKSSVHGLPSRPEVNALRYGLAAGDAVRFEYNGRTLTGTVARINKRATVMAEARKGRYSDQSGRRYSKYLVPLEQIQKL
ncbi:MAG: hypothetical protein P4L75_08285 [Clostridia bacterium]|nr:hypothetical protein [Clostridia bacterium]